MSIVFDEIIYTSEKTVYSDDIAYDFMHFLSGKLKDLIPGSTVENTERGFNLSWIGYTWQASYSFNNDLTLNMDLYKSSDLTTKISTSLCTGTRQYTTYPFTFSINYQKTTNDDDEFYLWLCDAGGVSKQYINPQFCKLKTTEDDVLSGFNIGGISSTILSLFDAGGTQYLVNYSSSSMPKGLGSIFVSGKFESPDKIVYTPVILQNVNGVLAGKILKSMNYVSTNKLVTSTAYNINGRLFFILQDIGIVIQYGTHLLFAFDCGNV